MFDYWFLCSRLGTSTDVHRTEALLESLRREWLVLSDCTLGGYQLVLLLLGDLLGNVASGAWFAEWHGRGSQDYLWLSVDLLSGGGPLGGYCLHHHLCLSPGPAPPPLPALSS